METITFQCRVITPMFLAGADGQTPELRAPSIKGAMRFWWRALNGHLPLEELKRREGKIFGDNGGRSCFTIRIINKNENQGQERPVPHKGYTLSAIRPESTFEVLLSIQETPEFSFNHLVALFELTAILGGFGKRSRRAMGGVKILKKTIGTQTESPQNNIDTTYILNLINLFSTHYQKKENTIFNVYQGAMQQYPWIKMIEIGENKGKNIPNHTSNVTHQQKNKYGQSYEPNLGHAFNGRFASPIIVSTVNDNNTPIITTMNTIPDRSHGNLNVLIQNDFKQSIFS